MRLKTIKSRLHSPNSARVILRIGLGFVFLYAAASTLVQPFVWAGYVPDFLLAVAPMLLILKLMALYELVLGAVLLSGLYVRYVSLLSALTLAAIVLVNPSQLIVTFRDIGLACTALSLFLLS